MLSMAQYIAETTTTAKSKNRYLESSSSSSSNSISVTKPTKRQKLDPTIASLLSKPSKGEGSTRKMIQDAHTKLDAHADLLRGVIDANREIVESSRGSNR